MRTEFLLDSALSSAIGEYLTKEGLTVENPGLVTGKSGANHTFDVIAYNANYPRKVVIDLATSEGSVTEQTVIALFAKVFDVLPDKAYLIAMPNISGAAKKMADLYSIQVVEAKNPSEAVACLKELMETV